MKIEGTPEELKEFMDVNHTKLTEECHFDPLEAVAEMLAKNSKNSQMLRELVSED